MKTKSLKKAIAGVMLLSVISTGITAQVKLTSSNYFQIGYSTYTPIMIGSAPVNGVDNGAWSIEYDGAGLNFWKPYPSPNSGNYKMFISNAGNVGIGRVPSFKLDVEGGYCNIWDTPYFI